MNQGFEHSDPIKTAQKFAATHSQAGYCLDFSLASLETEVDQLLETPLFCRGREASGTVEQDRNLAGLVAYVGEALRQAFGGKWGEGFVSRGDNYYTGFVQFGAYKYWPGHFLGYRLTNWPKEGTFAQHLKRILPEIQEQVSDG